MQQSSYSEYTLFKECVHNPRFLDKNLQQLNLSFIRDPNAPDSDQAPKDTSATDTLEVSQRKALRLFYMVWSGVTKCIRNMVQQQQKAIEISNFAIFGPIFESNQGRDPLDKGPAQAQRAAAMKLGICPVFVVINDEFLNTMNWEVALDQTSEKAVGRFNKHDKSEVNDLFKNKISPLALSSIASVCLTDVNTIELVLKEITTAMGQLARSGKSVRMNFKVGYLSIQNQLMQWQHSRELMRKHKVAQSIDGSQMSSMAASERPSNAISVITPSIAHHSRATSTDYRNHHMSNPNAQVSQSRFMGARDMGSSAKGVSSPNQSADMTVDLLRFGKRITFGNKVTNEELLQDHLKEMRQHIIEKKQQRSMQLEQDKNFLNKVKDRDSVEHQTKLRSSEILKNEFLFFNDQKMLDNRLKKQQEQQQLKKDKIDFFPFVSGELLDQHRQGMTVQMRADLKNYLVAKSQGMVGSQHGSSGHKRSVAGRYAQGGGSVSSASGSMYPTMDGHIDLRGDRLVRNTPLMAGQIKQLHDSCYVGPDQNHRVIQDNHPAKSNAWKQALQRHEDEIAKQKNFNQTVVTKHFERIQKDETTNQAETEVVRQKKQRFYEDIRNQMDQNVVRKNVDISHAKAPGATSFGPEETEHVILQAMTKDRKMKQGQRQELTNQMEAKKAAAEMAKRAALDQDMIEISSNNIALEVQKERKVKQRNDVKQFWQSQVEETAQQKQKEKDASDILKKQIAV